MAATKDRPEAVRAPSSATGDASREPGYALDWEAIAYGALILLAAILRFWDLGGRALHHDESLHALYSWYLFTGRGYLHDPMMHGPFQFHGTALVYFLFGVSDYTARVLPALFGTALVGLPYFMRGFLGRWGALAAAGMLAISPSFLYFSRFARNDIYIAFWTLLLVICLWRYRERRSEGYLYLGAAALALSFSTKEVTFITVAIFSSFLLLATAPEWWRALRQRLDFSHLSPLAVFLLLLGTLSLPQLSAAASLLQGSLGLTLAGTSAPIGAPQGEGMVVAGAIVLILLGVSVAVGLRWNRRRWIVSALVFYLIYELLFTTFLTNIAGLGSGIWQSLGYWIAQQTVERGGQPWYYYLILLPFYEFLPLSLALVATLYYSLKGDLFSRFLVYWVVAAFLLYGYAGEKMPWLVLHLTLPLIFIAARLIGELVERAPWRQLLRGGGLYLALLLPLGILGLRSLVSATTPREWLVFGLALLAVVGGGVWLGRGLGWRQSAFALAGAGVALMLAFTFRTATQAAYTHGDIPVEMLVYTQTSPQIPKIVADIERLAHRSGEDLELKITVDSTSGFTWPWAWYLRDYKQVDYPNLSHIDAEPRGSVLLLHASNEAAARPYLGKYGTEQRLPHRWWFPETYRGLTPERLWKDLTNGESWAKLWRYFLYREPPEPLGSEDAIAYFPKGFARGELALPLAEGDDLAEKQVALTSDLSFGGQGDEPGRFQGPKGIALDAQGNIYVLDGGNHRLQKFNPEGEFLAQVGSKGDGLDQFNEPWGVAVDGEGNVYVADTWNHRIVKLDGDLQPIKTWGQFGDARNDPQSLEGSFYGPRDIAIDGEGNLLVVDTGNKRIQRFDTEGNLLGIYGGEGGEPGRFREPVGIALDAQGNIYIADTWNRRIQKFDAAFSFLAQFPVAGWQGEGLLNKPYLAIGNDGSILATDPENHRLLEYSPEGELLAVAGSYGSGPSSLNLPLGLAVGGQGRIYVSESGNHRVQRFPPFSAS